ncbi:MAG: hypothetical protein C7N36_17365, partial [Bacteroidetes bacterium]
MEKNYNFRFKLEEPSSEDIRKRMDFAALLQQYEAAPAPALARGRVRRLVYLVSAAAAAVLLLVSLFFWSQPKQFTPEEYFAQQSYVHPPLPNLQPPYQGNTVADAYKGGIIEYPSGSRLVVPASAFMNDRGKLIGGEVEVHYRELHDYIDFFVSGIPLAYDSVGLQRYLTSAGMVEIYAEQNGKRLELAPGKAIQVELISEVPVQNYFTLPKYYVYQLDTAARTWVYRNVDMLQFVNDENWLGEGENNPERLWQQKLTQLETDFQQALQNLQLQYPLPFAPLEPTPAKGNRPTLELDFLSGEITLDPASDLQPADLAFLHPGTIWEITPESPAVDPRAFNVTWESVRLRRLNSQRFELTLIHSKNEEKLIVTPVLLGADYQRALASYQEEKQAYDAAVAARESSVAASRDTLQARFTQGKAALQAELSEELLGRPEQLTRKVVNRFVVNAFGVWNCAQPVTAPQTVQGVNYTDEKGNTIENVTAYVVNAKQNTIYRYLAASGASLGIEPATNNLLWIVDKDGGIAITRLEQLQDGGSKIILETVTPPVTSRATLR